MNLEENMEVEVAQESMEEDNDEDAADAEKEDMGKEDMGEGDAEYMLQRMFPEEFDHDDNVEVLLSSDSEQDPQPTSPSSSPRMVWDFMNWFERGMPPRYVFCSKILPLNLLYFSGPLLVISPMPYPWT